jgi:hypothetical protein
MKSPDCKGLNGALDGGAIVKKSHLGHAVQHEIADLRQDLETIGSKLRSRSGFDPASEGRLAALFESVGDVAAAVDDLERAVNEEEG